MKIYWAGPLFTLAERRFNQECGDDLRSRGHLIWLPQDQEPRHKTGKAVFEKDIEGINWADVVVANLDGPDPDSGTCFECGYAYGKKPIIVFRTDFRAGDDPDFGPCNLMLWESANSKILMPSTLFTINNLINQICEELSEFRS